MDIGEVSVAGMRGTRIFTGLSSGRAFKRCTSTARFGPTVPASTG